VYGPGVRAPEVCAQRGLVITADGQYHLIQPAALDADHGMHVVHKRSAAQIEQIMQKTCLFDARDDPLPIESDPSLTANKDRLPVVRVGLFPKEFVDFTFHENICRIRWCAYEISTNS
jgi:hypothetical protein